MKSLFIKFRNFFTESKVLFGRANSYITLINTWMLGFLMISKLQDYGIGISTKYSLLIIPGLIIFIWIVGWLDTRLGFFREEARRASSRNPYLTNILSEVQKINSRLDKIENSIHKPNETSEKAVSGVGEQI